MSDLEKLMGHIDYFYQHVASTYDITNQFEIYLKDKVWTIKSNKSDDILETKDHKIALEYCVANKVNLVDLHTMIHGNVCTEGVMRRMQLRDVEDLVGKDQIDEAEAGWKEMMEQLKGMLGLTEDEEEPKGLKLVE